MFRRSFILLVVGLTAIGGTTLMASELRDPVRVLPDDIPHAAPFFADIDGDGKKDLLVGQYRDDPFTGARVRFYRNIGTATQPRFSDGEFLQVGSLDAACDEFCHTGFGPQVVDFDGDGRSDLITGSRDCRLFVFSGEGGGQFTAARHVPYVTDKHVTHAFRYNARVFCSDWDADGDLDLLVARNRSISLFRNIGTRAAPKYAEPQDVATSTAKRMGMRVPVVADWDDDGRQDLIAARYDGSVVWYRNTADSGDPRLEDPRPLIGAGVPWQTTSDADGKLPSPKGPAHNIRLCATDFNGDGRMDLLVGDMWMHQRPKGDASPEETERRRTALAHYNRLTTELREMEKSLTSNSAAVRDAHQRKVAECAAAWRAAYVDGQRTTRHGAVWYFERIARN